MNVELKGYIESFAEIFSKILRKLVIFGNVNLIEIVNLQNIKN